MIYLNFVFIFLKMDKKSLKLRTLEVECAMALDEAHKIEKENSLLWKEIKRGKEKQRTTINRFVKSMLTALHSSDSSPLALGDLEHKCEALMEDDSSNEKYQSAELLEIDGK